MSGIAALLAHLTTQSVQRSIEKRQEKKLEEEIDFTKPKISSSPWKDLNPPRGLTADQIVCELSVRLDEASIQRGDKEELAKEMAVILQRILLQRNFSSSQESKNEGARFLCRIELTAANKGSRWNRYWKSDGGFVRTGLQFSLLDLSQTPSPIIKRGNLAYVNDMKDSSREERSGKGSGRRAMLLALEDMVSQLHDDVTTVKVTNPTDNLPSMS